MISWDHGTTRTKRHRGGSKAKSKGEIYRLLATEGGVYLPPLKDVNYQFLRDIITGSKKVCLLSSLYYLVYQRKSNKAQICSILQRSNCWENIRVCRAYLKSVRIFTRSKGKTQFLQSGVVLQYRQGLLIK